MEFETDGIRAEGEGGQHKGVRGRIEIGFGDDAVVREGQHAEDSGRPAGGVRGGGVDEGDVIDAGGEGQVGAVEGQAGGHGFGIKGDCGLPGRRVADVEKQGRGNVDGAVRARRRQVAGG